MPKLTTVKTTLARPVQPGPMGDEAAVTVWSASARAGGGKATGVAELRAARALRVASRGAGRDDAHRWQLLTVGIARAVDLNA